MVLMILLYFYCINILKFSCQITPLLNSEAAQPT